MVLSKGCMYMGIFCATLRFWPYGHGIELLSIILWIPASLMGRGERKIHTYFAQSTVQESNGCGLHSFFNSGAMETWSVDLQYWLLHHLTSLIQPIYKQLKSPGGIDLRTGVTVSLSLLVRKPFQMRSSFSLLFLPLSLECLSKGSRGPL